MFFPYLVVYLLYDCVDLLNFVPSEVLGQRDNHIPARVFVNVERDAHFGELSADLLNELLFGHPLGHLLARFSWSLPPNNADKKH
jgi:hypothetical protein